jgi:L-amino acid N-acyltransferase YncA
MVTIRRACPADFDAMWAIFHAIIAAGDSYVFAADTSRDEAFTYWFAPGVTSFVAEQDGAVTGMYKLIPNQRGRGDHVANASFMVDPAFSGRGIGRRMGEHALQEARRGGFAAMQFNFVVSTNLAAVRLWQRLGFTVVGVLPRVFRHPTQGLVDAYVMHRALDDIATPDACTGHSAN